VINEFPLSDYIIKTDIPKLHLVKAGAFDEVYPKKISTYDWPAFYDRSPYILRVFAERLAFDYDFVIIDSRTGLTDTSGICAMLMPELLVTVFTPNRQSLFGVIDLAREAARYRAASNDLRPLLIFPLPSRIESLEPALRQKWRYGDPKAGVPGFQPRFEEAFKSIYALDTCDLTSYFDEVQIQHVPSYAYGEEIALLVEEARDRFSLTQSYARFAARLKRGEAPWERPPSSEKPTLEQILASRPVQPGSQLRWFLSYHSPDETLAAKLKTAIEMADPASHVLFAPARVRHGGAWSDQLAREMAQATGFILLIGEHGVGKWQIPEYNEALDRWVKSDPPSFPLIVVLIQGQTAPGLPFLRRLHWIVTPDPASEAAVARIFDAASGAAGPQAEPWRFASPYRGLEAMEEKDSDFFFGRTRETVEALDALAERGRLPIVIGSSGVGKSSLAQAGVLAALKRQAWPDKARAADAWPAVFQNSRRWAFLTMKPGAEPIKALVDCFLDSWQYAASDHQRVKLQLGWIELLRDKATLADLIDATERRRGELDQPAFPAFFLYIDQGEELYARAAEPDRNRFSNLLGEALSDPRLRVMMSLRSDFLGSLQSDAPLFAARRLIETPPLGEDALREVVNRPAEALGARFAGDQLVDVLARRAAADPGGLPLLSYTLDEMWSRMVKAGDGVLRLPMQAFALESVLVDRAEAFLAANPGAEESLRRLMTLKLANVSEDGEAIRRRADRPEFSDQEWRLVTELADHPNRLLVTATTSAGETYAEVAHETIFRRWDRLRAWIEAEREFLIWRGGVEAARKAWRDASEKAKGDALLMGLALTRAQDWLARRKDEIDDCDQAFIVASGAAAGRRKFWSLAPVAVLVVVMALGAAAWLNQNWLTQEIFALLNATPLPAAQAHALQPGDSFKECRDCPEMIVVSAGRFLMGSPASEGNTSERPQHEVTISKPFAVSKFEVTFEEWDACVKFGDCNTAWDQGWGRGRRPAVNVNWDDAQTYVKWLSRITGKTYRLLSEAEYEYAARAGSKTAFPWGADIKLDGKPMANCSGCGSERGGERTSPVGSFPPNAFGLFDMVGNVWEWTEDCWNPDYEGAPGDGSAWTSGDCNLHVVRGGAWNTGPELLRSANRGNARLLFYQLGFRVTRTLAP
jgi:formylglycine-generating enzyme required for sulfatase activity